MPQVFLSRRPGLNSRDIIAHEHVVRDLLAEFAPFKEYRLHFPPAGTEAHAEWLPRERRLLIPLRGVAGEGLLGVFAVRPLSARAARQALPLIEKIAALCLEQVRLLKAAAIDAATGLTSRDRLLEAASAEIESMRGPQPASETWSLSAGAIAAGAGFGLIALDFSGLREVAREHGYDFANQLLRLLAETLIAETANQAIAGRSGEFEFAVLAPGSSASACLRLAESLAGSLRGVTKQCAVTGEVVGAPFGCGLAMFPADADLGPGAFGGAEQAQRLLARARKAAAVAAESANQHSPAMPFSRILAEGGHVLEVRPFSRLLVSLGAAVRAAEGQRFSAWGTKDGNGAERYKGDLVLASVRENVSDAEILRLDDPAAPIRPGDRLVLLTERAASARPGNLPNFQGEALDPASGFLRHRNFLAHFNEVSRRRPAFCLALVRVSPPHAGPLSPGMEDTADEAVHILAQRCRAAFGPDLAGGRYGLNSLILWHPDIAPDDLRRRYEALARAMLAEDSLETGTGIASHPFLDFHKADALENCVNALEYALLLPPPHVGLFDSLGLTVQADKLLNQGDAFGAVAAYKRALLANPANHTAHNSLGVCLAGLGRHAEAERHFLEALRAQPASVHTHYNLGTVYQAMNDTSRARAQFKACLKHAPDHIYACLRLGQLAEAENSLKRARHWYSRAERLPGGLALTRRPLAALALKQGKTADGRRLLYDALSHNPLDAAALGLLAQLYMDEGEAPSLAEALARQSIAIRPENGRNWLTLAAALEALGKPREAHAARAKAR